NRAERFLADPEIRQMRAEAARRFRLLCKSRLNPDTLGVLGLLGIDGLPPALADDVIFWSDLLVSQPCAFFITDFGSDAAASSEINGCAVINIGDSQKHVAAMLTRYKAMAGGAIKETTVDGNTEYSLIAGSTPVRWSLRERHLIITCGNETPSQVAKRMKGREPEWLAAIARQLPVERRAAVVRINPQPFFDAVEDAATIKKTGLDHIRYITLVTGLDREDFVSRVLVETDPARWEKLIARPLAPADLAVVPGDATLSLAVNIEPACLLTNLASLQETSNTVHGEAKSNSGAADGLMSLATGDVSGAGSLVGRSFTTNFKFDKELSQAMTASLGDAWRLYTSPSEGSLGLVNITGVVHVNDRDRLARAFDALAARKPPEPASKPTAGRKSGSGSAKDDKSNATEPAELLVRKSRFADHDVYLFHRSDKSAATLVACCIVGSELVCSASPQNVKAYLLRQPGQPSLADEPAVKEALSAKRPPSLICYEDSREMFRLTYPLMQCAVNVLATNVGLHAGGPDPMLLPAAPTVAKYLRPAVSTITLTPQGVEATIHQSLPNGNLGSLLYLVACSSLPENPDAWTGEATAKTATAETTSEEKRPTIKFLTFSEKEGPCAELAAFSLSGGQKVTAELGKNIHGVCTFQCEEFFGKPMLNANISLKNNSKEHLACQYYAAFFDKAGKLVGCTGQGNLDFGLAPGAQTSFGSCLIFLPIEQMQRIASYKVRLYEAKILREEKSEPVHGDKKAVTPLGTFGADQTPLQRGLAAVHAERYEEAIPLLTEALRLDPTRTEALRARGDAYHATSDYKKAVIDYSEAIRLEPNAAAGYWHRGLSFLRLRELSRALSDCADSIRLEPKEPGGYYVRGLVHQDRGDLGKAVGDFTTAIQLNGRIPGPFLHRAQCLADQEQYATAIKDFTTVIEIDHGNARAYRGRARARYGQKEYAKAMADCTEGLRLEPRDATLYRYRAGIHEALGDHDKAVADVTESISLAPQDARSYLLRGCVYLRTRNAAKAAIGDFSKVISLEPQNAMAYQLRGEVNNAIGAHEAAIADYTQAIKLRPEGVEAYRARSSVYRAMGKIDEAIADLDAAIRLAEQKRSQSTKSHGGS
ncbi:MAG: tetratricopeptide repeat protein, partial [Planctomycetaceae bacterium]|nr:tetratricopeptide repeat protein [Planctomycetaceae bacterium]